MIKVKALNFSYGKDHKILENISFKAERGQCIAVLGNNGAGKSTLVKCLNRILMPKMGTVMVQNLDVKGLSRQEIARQMAYVAQTAEPSSISVYDAVLLGRTPHIRLNPTKEDHAITRKVLDRLGLNAYMLKNINELSGGELQKVMLARAVAQKPNVLILDEPTSNLDLKNQYEVLSIVRKIATEDEICVIMVIHDLNLALRYCDYFLMLKDNKIHAHGPSSIMTNQLIQDVYGIEVVVETIRGYRTVVPIAE